MAVGKPPHCDKSPLQVIFYIPRSDPPNLPEDQLEWSMDFRDFISKCCTKDPKQRPSAKELLQHKWIRQAKGIRIIQQLVQNSQPKVEEMRKKKKEEEEAKMREEEELEQAEMREYGNDDDYNQYGTSIYNDGTTKYNGGDDQYGTAIYNDGTTQFNDGTMVRMDDDGNGDQYGTTVFNDSTMVRMDDGNEMEPGYGDGQYDTMLRSDDTPVDNYGTMLIQKDDDAKDEEEDNAIYGTMYINDGVATGKIDTGKVKVLESVFKDNKYVDQLLPIPQDVTKEELFAIFTRIKAIDKKDKDDLEKFYKAQIGLLDERIKLLGE